MNAMLRTTRVVLGIVIQPRVFMIWNGRAKQYIMVTIHR